MNNGGTGTQAQSSSIDLDMIDVASLSLHQDPPPASDPGVLRTPVERDHRPWDDTVAAGPPANPVNFDRPRFERGLRSDVLCYDPDTDKHKVAKNVLFRDYSRECGDDEEDDDEDMGVSRVTQAYWPIPHKKPIKTIMGHVEICIVLERCIRENDDVETGQSREGDSYDELNDDDDDDDVVFQLTSRHVAVKVNNYARMEFMRGRHAEDPLKEVAAMQWIGNDHPNVLGLSEVLFDGKNLNMVMRYCSGGDMFALLQEAQLTATDTCPGLPEGQARYWFRQIMEGLRYLHHESGICHRDLSPENVMVDPTTGALIIDMGMCLRVPYSSATPSAPSTNALPPVSIREGRHKLLFREQGTCGKLPYMSPEIFRSRHPFDGEAADVWTTGTILFCMVTGNRSYERPCSSDPQYYWMTHDMPKLLSDWNVSLSPAGVHLLQNILQVNPRLRLTIQEILNHPWLAMPDEIPPRMPQSPD